MEQYFPLPNFEEEEDPYFEETSKDYFMQKGHWIVSDELSKTYLDTVCIANDYISITPLTIDRTNIEVFNKISKMKKDLK